MTDQSAASAPQADQPEPTTAPAPDRYAGFAGVDADELDELNGPEEKSGTEENDFSNSDDKPQERLPPAAPEPAEVGPAEQEVPAPSASASAPPPPVQPPPPSPPRVVAPEEFDQALRQLDEELNTLARKYEDADISFSAYREQERAINDRRQGVLDYRRQQEFTQQQAQRDWQQAVSAFFAQPDHQPFGAPGLLPLMREEIQALWRRPDMADKPYADVLATAAAGVRATLRHALGIPEPAAPTPATAVPAALPKEVADLRAAREARLKNAQATPATGTRAPALADPFDGYAATD